jgi:hypothetical protein
MNMLLRSFKVNCLDVMPVIVGTPGGGGGEGRLKTDVDMFASDVRESDFPDLSTA